MTLKGIIMEHYASKKDTVNALLKLGLVRSEINPKLIVTTKTKKDPETDIHSPLAVFRIYQSGYGYWCVEHVPGGWQAPVVWNGPKAEWDQINPTQEFTDYLNEVAPGWR